jgi:hypothetical protein
MNAKHAPPNMTRQFPGDLAAVQGVVLRCFFVLFVLIVLRMLFVCFAIK